MVTIIFEYNKQYKYKVHNRPSPLVECGYKLS